MLATVSTNETGGSAVSYFSPDDFLINIVKRAVTHAQDVVITLPGAGEVVVLSAQGEYIANAIDIAEFCEAPADRFRVTVMADAGNGPQDGNARRNLDELMWQAGFFASRGRLMQGCFRDDVVQLRHWPNFSRLPATPNSMRIAALLTRYPTSITLAHRLLKITAAEIYQFYSAARCAGLAHALNRKPEEPILKPHRNQALLGLLLKKITGL